MKGKNTEPQTGERDLEGREPLFRAGARPDPATVTRYVEERRDAFAVEPICSALGVPVSTFYARRSRSRPAASSGTEHSWLRSIPPARATDAGDARSGRTQGDPALAATLRDSSRDESPTRHAACVPLSKSMLPTPRRHCRHPQDVRLPSQ